MNESPAETLTATGGAFSPATGTPGIDEKIAKEQAAAKKSPRDPAPLVRLARLWFLKARDAQDDGVYLFARDALERAREIAPDDPDVLALAGALALQDHAFADARKSAEALLKANPRAAEGWGILSDAALETGDYTTAMEAAQNMVDLRPDSRSYARAAWLQWLQGDWDAADATMQLAMSALPAERTARAWLVTQRGVLKYNTGALDDALALATEALTHAPAFADAHTLLARVLRAKGDTVGAIAHAREAVKPGRGLEAQWLLAQLLEQTSAPDAAEAFAAIERMRAMDPRTAALALASKGVRCDEAVRLAREEQRARPDVTSDDVLAWALHCAKDDAGAWESSVRAQRLHTRDARMLYHHGMIALRKGELETARTALTDALAVNTYWDAREVEDARAALRTMGPRDAGAEAGAR